RGAKSPRRPAPAGTADYGQSMTLDSSYVCNVISIYRDPGHRTPFFGIRIPSRKITRVVPTAPGSPVLFGPGTALADRHAEEEFDVAPRLLEFVQHQFHGLDRGHPGQRAAQDHHLVVFIRVIKQFLLARAGAFD